MRSIFLRLCRSEKDDSDDGGGELIGAILMACEGRVPVLPSVVKITLIVPTGGLRAASLRGSWCVWP